MEPESAAVPHKHPDLRRFLGLPQPPPPTGKGGTITVHGLAGSGSSASSVLIDGAGSGLFTNTVGTGAAGNTNIAAQSVTVQNGGTISAETSGTAQSATGGTIIVNANEVQVNSGGPYYASTTGAGAGGSVNINASNNFSSNAGTVSSTANQANGGNLNISTGQSATLTNGANISASSTGTGNAGNIQINAGNQFAMTNSTVTTEANQASGGAIKITTNPNGTVQLTDSTISASVLDGNGGGGSVNIDPQYVVLQNSQILAKPSRARREYQYHDESPATGFDQRHIGLFAIRPARHHRHPIAHFSSQRQDRSARAEAAARTTLLSQRCAALAGGNASSFTVAGRDSLPAEPSGWISSPLALSMAEFNEGTATETAFSSFSEMAVETPLLSVRKIAPPGFLTQSFGVDASDCHS